MKKNVKLQLSRYLSKELSKEALYKWALDLLHQMLKGDIFDIRYLEIWGIITELTEINDIDDLSCNRFVQHLFKILSGDECGSFIFAMQIPEKFVVNNLLQIEKILKKYSVDHHLSRDEIEELKLITQKNTDTFNTLNEILEVQIIDLLKLGYEYYDNESSIEFNLKSTVFISEDVSASLEDSLLSKAITLLECYEGKKCFYVHTSFKNGVCNISIQV